MSTDNTQKPPVKRRSSRVRFEDEVDASEHSLPPAADATSTLSHTNSDRSGEELSATIGDYYFDQEHPATPPIPFPQPAAAITSRRPPQTFEQRARFIPRLEPGTSIESSRGEVGGIALSPTEFHQANDDTRFLEDANPFGTDNGSNRDRYSFGSHNHPLDTSQAPHLAYSSTTSAWSHLGAQPRYEPPRGRASEDTIVESNLNNARSFPDDKGFGDPEKLQDFRDFQPQHHGVLGNLLDLSDLNRGSFADSQYPDPRYNQYSMSAGRMSRATTDASYDTEHGLDPDDPNLTGIKSHHLDDPDDLESQTRRTMELQSMSYRQRRKEALKIKIQYNVTSMLNRRRFVVKLARALMTFGAPSHRIESQLVAAARILEIDAEFIHLPNIILVCFGDPETKTSETHFIKCGGRLSLGALHSVHQIYRAVVHDEISAKRATSQLDEILEAPPIYGTWTRCIIAFFLSALICPLAFGGSTIDMWISGAGAFVLCALQLTVVTKSALYANVFEITVAISISFLARGLSSIRSQIFCYTAISSAAIVGILPGYLILSSSLELASKNILCGSVKMVYALIYTLFLGFGLQIGSDLYLLFDRSARQDLNDLAAAITRTILYTGTFVSDNTTRFAQDAPLAGTFTFSNGTTYAQQHIVSGCYREPSSLWYLQPYPFWTQFIIVPIFSVLSSLANLQPWCNLDMVVMVGISCASYAANKAANHFIFNRSDVVSAIGAFVVGVLGNVYSRKFSGTAFTSMVTGVLFLVPSGLSQAGGITASGNGIDIGAAMIAVTIGITVGLFMSQAIVYMFGTRKNAAMFSF